MSCNQSKKTLDEKLADLEAISKIITEAVRKAITGHRHAKNPVAIWRDNKVVWIASEDIDDDGYIQ